MRQWIRDLIKEEVRRLATNEELTKPPRAYHSWTSTEDELLEKRIWDSIDIIARMHGRSPSAIWYRILHIAQTETGMTLIRR